VGNLNGWYRWHTNKEPVGRGRMARKQRIGSSAVAADTTGGGGGGGLRRRWTWWNGGWVRGSNKNNGGRVKGKGYNPEDNHTKKPRLGVRNTNKSGEFTKKNGEGNGEADQKAPRL